MTVAMVVLLPVPAKPVSKTGCFFVMAVQMVSNASCCCGVSFIAGHPDSNNEKSLMGWSLQKRKM